VKQPEAHRLLDLGVAVQFDIGTVPELVQVVPLLGEQAIPAGQPTPASAPTTWSISAGLVRWLDQP